MATEGEAVEMGTFNLTATCNYSWKIINFSKQLTEIRSSKFSPTPAIPEEFYIMSERKRGRLGDETVGSDCFFNLVRCSDEGCSPTLRVQFDVKILNSDGDVMQTSCDDSSYLVHREKTIVLLKQESWDNYLECGAAFFNTLDDIVIVSCHFQFFEHNMANRAYECLLVGHPPHNLSALSSHFKSLYESKMLCDMEILVGGKILLAHLAVLAARSPVLKNMIRCAWLVTRTNCLVIPGDVSTDVFDSFLKYLYSGDIEDVTFSKAWNLYPLATKYDVPCLRKICSDILVSYLSEHNVWAVLEFSDLHKDRSLKVRVLRFITTTFSELPCPECNVLFSKNELLFFEVLAYFNSDDSDE